MARDTVTVNSIIIERLNKIESTLDKQNIILESIQKQTILTNGRVNTVERDIVESKLDRKEIHVAIESLTKSYEINDGIKKDIREVQLENKQTNRYWFSETRSFIPIIITIIMSLITIYVTFIR